MSRGLSLEGQQFGQLKVLSRVGSRGPRALWRVDCVCGNRLFFTTAEVKKYKSCGCLRYRKDPRRSTPVYLAWAAMKNRCKHSPRYVRRNIKVCRRWLSFESFYEDMASAYRPGLTLDRVDNDKGYSPSNCRWATPLAQSTNKRNNVRIDTPWGNLTLSQAAQKAGISAGTLRNRFVMGWSGNALFAPVERGGDRRSKNAARRQAARRK